MKRLHLLLFVCLISCLYAGHRNWEPETAQRLWTQSTNWRENAVPGVGDFAWINVDGSACVVNSVVTVDQFSVGSSNTGQLVIANGGTLTTTGWCGNGMGNGSSVGTVTVEAGGTLNLGDHFWTGHAPGDVGITIINGGTVRVGHQLGLGWDGGTGYMYVNRGTLNLANWTGQTISGTSIMDVSEGQVIVNGDHTSEISALVAAGRITGYGGQGKVVYDYSVTHSGKTTIQAEPPIPGDLNHDFGVDVLDLQEFAGLWLSGNYESVANLDERGTVDFHDFSIFSANWLGGTKPHWHVAQTRYPTDDLIVTPYYASNFGIMGDGVTDDTEAIQNALLAISNIGGGALFLPAGYYKVSGNLTIPSCVVLRGDWQIPDFQEPVTGTVLMAYAGRGQDDDTGQPFIGLSNCAGLKGLTIWYPEQTYDNIVQYPPSIRRIDGSNHSVENVTFVNAYIGFSNYSGQITASPFVRHIYGTPLKTGIEFDCLADVGRLETVHFAPDYWKNSGLPGAPTNNQHAGWLYDQATGVVLGRIDWSYAAYVTVEGYCRGMLLHPTRNPNNQGSTPNGQCYAFDLKNCRTGVYVENSAGVGFMFTRFNIDQAQTGMEFASTANGTALIHTCQINAVNYALKNAGRDRIQVMSSTFKNGLIKSDDGYLSITNSDFDQPAGWHVNLGSSVDGATFQGNRFARSPIIYETTSAPVWIDHSAVAVAPLSAYEYKKPSQPHTAAKTDLFVVTEPPYNAADDHSADATPAFQAALADAGANGGGIVLVPGGDYRLDRTLTVPTGVELRGIYDLAYSPSARGSVLNTYYGKNQENGTPFIQIESHAGIRGLTIHHAGQIYDGSNQNGAYGLTPYPYAIRGLGSDVYIISIAMTIPWQMLDLATNRCDRHYVDYILGTAMKTGIHVGGGSVDGQIQNCQFNPSAYAFHRSQYKSIPDSGDLGGVYDLAWRQATPYLIGDVSGEVLHQNFVFGGMIGGHFVDEGSGGPSGHCLGLGIDQCTTSIRVDGIGRNGMSPINSQIVTVDYQNGCYLATGTSLDNPFTMFSTCCWGGSERGLRIDGGNVELQMCQIDSWGWVNDTTYTVGDGATLRAIGSSTTQSINTVCQLDPGGMLEIISNMLHIDSSGMPRSNGVNLFARGNLRAQ